MKGEVSDVDDAIDRVRERERDKERKSKMER